jgi:hypothetical protein
MFSMDAEIERLINDMLVKGRVYIEAIQKRDQALAECFQDETPEADIRWTAASDASEKARREYNNAVMALHAARRKG